MGTVKEVEIGFQVPPVSRVISQERINLFEACEVVQYANIHNDEETARTAGVGAKPIASGRMTSAFIVEALAEWFGESWSHTGMIDIRFLRPVRDGDTVTVKARVAEKVPDARGMKVVFEVSADNQNGEQTAVGTASAILT